LLIFVLKSNGTFNISSQLDSLYTNQVQKDSSVAIHTRWHANYPSCRRTTNAICTCCLIQLNAKLYQQCINAIAEIASSSNLIRLLWRLSQLRYLHKVTDLTQSHSQSNEPQLVPCTHWQRQGQASLDATSSWIPLFVTRKSKPPSLIE
jgi:hypothetical protein